MQEKIQFEINAVLLNFLLSKNPQKTLSSTISDTEDWSNDAENSALHHSNKFDFHLW